MRVIAGSARGTRLMAPKGLSVRPATDRAKEMIFEVIGDTVRGAEVADVFAGSGSLGIEALSRGASFCLFAEKHPSAIRAIEHNLLRTKLSEKAQVLRVDVLRSSRRLAEQGRAFGIIFLDPPYAIASIRDPRKGLHALMRAIRDGVVQDDGVVIVRHQRGGFAVHDSWGLRLMEKRGLGEMEFSIMSPERPGRMLTQT